MLTALVTIVLYYEYHMQCTHNVMYKVLLFHVIVIELKKMTCTYNYTYQHLLTAKHITLRLSTCTVPGLPNYEYFMTLDSCTALGLVDYVQC